MENRFMDVKEVAEYLCVSESKAYKIIQMLNSELRAQGYITIAGRVSRAYFERKVYSDRAAAV